MIEDLASGAHWAVFCVGFLLACAGMVLTWAIGFSLSLRLLYGSQAELKKEGTSWIFLAAFTFPAIIIVMPLLQPRRSWRRLWRNWEEPETP